jgi:hypothetical protein
MAEKSAKKRSKKAADASVMGNLSSTRPTRLGGERRSAASPRKRTTATATAPRGSSASGGSASSKPKPARKTSAPKATKAKAAKLRKPEPAPPAGWQTPGEEPRGNGATDVVSTAIQAAGELAQLGATIGGQLIKRAAGRIPRP